MSALARQLALNTKKRVICKTCDEPLTPGRFRCKSCGTWNHSEEEDKFDDGSVTLKNVKSADLTRVQTGEWDYVWGGKQYCDLCRESFILCKCPKCGVEKTEVHPWRYGIVLTSCTLLGGFPGAGKSTLLLQLCRGFWHATRRESLYIAAEEADDEIKARADRLQFTDDEQDAIRVVPAMGGIADTGEILQRRNPGLIIVDSLQGLVGEDQAASVQLLQLFKKFSVILRAPSIVISHFTKEGDYKGVMTLQHAVDTLLTLAPDDDGTRVLDVRKNRMGRAFIQMRFEMTETGLIALPEPVEEPEPAPQLTDDESAEEGEEEEDDEDEEDEEEEGE